MTGVQEPNVIDHVTIDAQTGEYVLIMIESRQWTDSPEQQTQLTEKINNYASFAIDEGLLGTYPDAAGHSVRIQLDCAGTPTPKVNEIINAATEGLLRYGIRYVVNILD